jgi:hypothetical protein
MERVVQLFGLSPEPAFLARIAQSPVLGRYSKAPDRPFTRGTRAELLRQSRRDHGAEIAKGLAWLEALARADPAVAAIVESGREPA